MLTCHKHFTPRRLGGQAHRCGPPVVTHIRAGPSLGSTHGPHCTTRLLQVPGGGRGAHSVITAAGSDPPSTSANKSDGEDGYESDGGTQNGKPSKLKSVLLKLPLLYASTYAKSNDHWLEQRNRQKWWKRGDFPKIPVDHIETVHLGKKPIKLWQKVLPLGLIFFCASFNLTLLQNMKDSIIVTAAGVETLPVLASFCVLPMSLAFFAMYSRLVAALNPKYVFYATLAPLVAFYVFFAAVLFPNAAALHPTGLFENLCAHVPPGLHGFLRVIEMWSFSLFFCVAELWGAVAVALLFWSLANDVCTVDEAKTIYPMMGISANLALVVAGNYMKLVNRNFAPGDLGLSIQIFVGTVVVSASIMAATKYWMDHKQMVRRKQPDAKKPKKRSKGSFKDSIDLIRSSPKIRNLAILVVSYAVAHRLFEFAWKGQLRVLFPLAAQYQGALSDVSIATGYTTIALMLLGKFVFEYLGWGFAAAATPVVMLVAGAAFFALSMASGLPNGASLAAAGVTAGAATQVFARSSKFSLFDPAKEMVYIEMEPEEKSKGKAAVDLVGSQLGKSGSAWMIQILLLGLGSISAALPYISAMYLMVIATWLTAAFRLKAQLKAHNEEVAAQQAAKRAAEGAGDGDGGISAAAGALGGAV